MAPRYIFVLPDTRRPMGGQNVLYGIAEILIAEGRDVAVVNARKRHRYPFFHSSAPHFHNPDQANLRRIPRSRRAEYLRELWTEWLTSQPSDRYVPGAGDVMVLPEFFYPEYARVYGDDRPMILVAQDVFGLMRAYTRDCASARPRHPDFTGVLATSEASAAAVRALLGRAPHRVTLPVSAPAPRPEAHKRLQIAYLPRKRAEESAMVVQALRLRPALRDVPVVPIENVSRDELDRILRESLVFLAFSEQEGFGLPPAEAMAAECLVIGYTGIGGNEYFTAERGFPIEDNDVISYLETVDRVVTQYRDDPAELDRMRRAAGAHIRTTYTVEAFRNSLLRSWDAIESARA